MKQMLLVLFVACSMLVQAQTFMVNDFESSTIGSDGGGCRVEWSGTGAVVANPNPGLLNPSANVYNVTNTKGWLPVAIPVTLPAGKSWTDYDGIRLKFLPVSGVLADFGWQDMKVGLDVNSWTPNIVGTYEAFNNAQFNTWYTADIPFDQTLLAANLAANTPITTISVTIDLAGGDNVDIDDIQLIEHQDPNREVTLGFEDPTLVGSTAGIQSQFGPYATTTVIANPVTTGINHSKQCFEVSDAPTSGAALAVNILPINGDWHNYDNVTFKILCTSYDQTDPWFSVKVGGGPIGWTAGTSQLSAGLGIMDLNKWYSVTVPIGSVANSSAPFLNLQANPGVNYLLDDISLLFNPPTTGLKTSQSSTLKVARISSNQYQITIGSASTYQLLNVEGRVIKSGIFESGSNSLQVANLASGIYLLKTISTFERNVVKIIR